MVRHVFVTPLPNALKFTQHERDTTVEVGTCEDHGTTIYHVRDNGSGFDMAYADKLFGVFQRLHDGTVWADGAEGEGTTFYFTLDRLDDSKR